MCLTVSLLPFLSSQVVYSSKKYGFVILYVTATDKNECADWVASLRQGIQGATSSHWTPVTVLIIEHWLYCRREGAGLVLCVPTLCIPCLTCPHRRLVVQVLQWLLCYVWSDNYCTRKQLAVRSVLSGQWVCKCIYEVVNFSLCRVIQILFEMHVAG